MANFDLASIHPGHRMEFIAYAAMHGVHGTPPKPKANDLLSQVPENLQFSFASNSPTYGMGEKRDLTEADPIRVAARAILAKQAEAVSPVDPTNPSPPAKRGRATKVKPTGNVLDEHVWYATMPVPSLATPKRSYNSGVTPKRRIYYFEEMSRLLFLEDLASFEHFQAFLLSLKLPINSTTPVYLHGLRMEGIHFNTDNPAIVAEANRLFTILTDDTNRPITTRKKAPPGTPYTVRKHVCIAVGKYVLTSMMDHGDWRDVAPVPEAELVSDDTFLAAWSGVLLNKLSEEHTSIQDEAEGLRVKLIELDRRRGQIGLLIRGAKEHNRSELRSMLEKLRTIPELEQFKTDAAGFTVITKDMLVTLERTGEERYGGKFEIQVAFTGQVRIRNIASPHADYRNPHNDCVGSYSHVFGSALATFDYYTLILAAMQYYRDMDKSYESWWKLLPNSKVAPDKTYVSDWHDIVGSFNAAKAGNSSDTGYEEQLVKAPAVDMGNAIAWVRDDVAKLSANQGARINSVAAIADDDDDEDDDDDY